MVRAYEAAQREWTSTALVQSQQPVKVVPRANKEATSRTRRGLLLYSAQGSCEEELLQASFAPLANRKTQFTASFRPLPALNEGLLLAEI